MRSLVSLISGITCNQNAGTQSMMMMMMMMMMMCVCVCVCVCVCARARARIHGHVCSVTTVSFCPYFINGCLQIQINNYLHIPVLYYNVIKLNI